MNIENIKLGIVKVIWDYDDLEEERTAFYEIIIKKVEDKYQFINNFSFLDNEICTSYDDTKTYIFKLDILEYINNNTIKVNLCGDIVYLSLDQYNLINERITNLQSKYDFDTSISKK